MYLYFAVIYHCSYMYELRRELALTDSGYPTVRASTSYFYVMLCDC